MKEEISPLTLKKHKKVIKKYYRKKLHINKLDILYEKAKFLERQKLSNSLKK